MARPGLCHDLQVNSPFTCYMGLRISMLLKQLRKQLICRQKCVMLSSYIIISCHGKKVPMLMVAYCLIFAQYVFPG